MGSIAFKVKFFCLFVSLQFLAVLSAHAEQFSVSCPASVNVNFDTKETTPLGKSAFQIYFSHPPGWDVHYEAGNTYQDYPVKTSSGKSLIGLFAGLKDLSSVPLHKLTVLGLVNGKKEVFSRVICQYRIVPSGGFRITVAKSMPTTHTCIAQGNELVTCIEKTRIYCPAKLTNMSIPKGWKPGLINKFTPSRGKITPLCQTMPITSQKMIYCKYCGATEDSFFAFKQPFPENQVCASLPSDNFATCYYPGTKLDPL